MDNQLRACRESGMNRNLFEKAVYRKESELLFMGNPLIEAVPFLGDPLEYGPKLLVRMPYSEDERKLSRLERLNKLQYIKQLHVPSTIDTEIAMNIDRCLHWGYYGRNPMPMSVVQSAVEEAGIPFDDSLKKIYRSYKQPTYGFPVFGVSGVGKTCSVMNVLTNYPQVIVHTNYRNQPFLLNQLVWLKVDCPPDGTTKGLCHQILQEMDEVLGTTFSTQHPYNRISKDVMLGDLSKAIRSCCLGLLVIDDVQVLCNTKDQVSKETLNFLLSLVNNADIPIVMIGAPKFISIIQSEFQQAKRVTGEGEVHMELLKKESGDWNRFMKGLWRYQYTQKTVPLDEAMADAFYEETVGNQFLLAILYKLVQDYAIINLQEAFTPETVHKVADYKLGLTKKQREDMKSGKDVELQEFEKLWNPPTLPPEVLVQSRKEPQTDFIQDLTSKLVSEQQLSVQEARTVARQVRAALPVERDPNTLYLYALELIRKSKNAASAGSNVEANAGNPKDDG